MPIAGPGADRGRLVQLPPGPLRRVYGIELADGGVAHTACLGFGLERVTLALFRAHGLDPRAWPDEVRAELWRA